MDHWITKLSAASEEDTEYRRKFTKDFEAKSITLDKGKPPNKFSLYWALKEFIFTIAFFLCVIGLAFYSLIYIILYHLGLVDKETRKMLEHEEK
jgi:hypothetical protein